jgi:hypothetical protein
MWSHVVWYIGTNTFPPRRQKNIAVYQITWHHITEDHNLHNHWLEKLESHRFERIKTELYPFLYVWHWYDGHIHWIFPRSPQIRETYTWIEWHRIDLSITKFIFLFYRCKFITQFTTASPLSVTNFMELSPSWEGISCAGTQELPNIYGTWRFITVLF